MRDSCLQACASYSVGSVLSSPLPEVYIPLQRFQILWQTMEEEQAGAEKEEKKFSKGLQPMGEAGSLE
jgi:hypothetical protein